MKNTYDSAFELIGEDKFVADFIALAKTMASDKLAAIVWEWINDAWCTGYSAARMDYDTNDEE